MPGEKKDPTDQEILIEEKKTKPNGEVQIRKYIKGRFLGKVSLIHLISNNVFMIWINSNSYDFANREDLPSAMNSHV